jgi:hypothetical protein
MPTTSQAHAFIQRARGDPSLSPIASEPMKAPRKDEAERHVCLHRDARDEGAFEQLVGREPTEWIWVRTR